MSVKNSYSEHKCDDVDADDLFEPNSFNRADENC
jgi:hypothetical protein